MESVPSLCMQGWLAKRGPTADFEWRRRWCVLRGVVLECYVDDSCSSKREVMEILGESRFISIRAKNAPGDAVKHYRRACAFVFDIRPSGGANRRLHYFDALDEVSFASWMKALSGVARHASLTSSIRVSSLKLDVGSRTPSEASMSTAITSMEEEPSSPTVSEAHLSHSEEQELVVGTPSEKEHNDVGIVSDISVGCELKSSESWRRSCLNELLPHIHAAVGRKSWCVIPLRRLEEARSVEGDWNELTLHHSNRLAWHLYTKNFLELAERLYRHVLDGQRSLVGACHPSTWEASNNLAITLQAIGRLDESYALLLDALDGSRNYLGPSHPDTLQQVSNLAALEFARGQHEASEALYREALHGRRRVFGKEHCATLQSIDHLAALLRKRGRFDLVEQLCREALAVRRERLGEAHPDTLDTLKRLVSVLRSRGRYAESTRFDFELRTLRMKHDLLSRHG
eukprot:TRINITY_DN41016_c0_g1_i1.p1 TRINITY_DN41016_c0_g1~~TRINITY_DN41016_c0_g1_i1.p1  ORF type:complete len:479 (-),score=54.11 TRINITY_DN41016_c0_g1_i1:257-1630(-)